MLRLSDNPERLFPRVDDLSRMAGTWWVAHTKSRCEKAFAHDLAARSIAYFLPMQPRVIFSGGRKRFVMMPLFPSYVFFCGDTMDRQAALATRKLCRVIDVCDQCRLISELSATNRVLEANLQLDPHPFTTIGTRVRVTCGPLAGIEGTVIRCNGVARLVLQVSILGQSTSMEIDARTVEPVEESRGVAI